MKRRILFFCFLFFFNPLANAQKEAISLEVVSQTKLGNFERFTLTFRNEVEDEIWPDLYFGLTAPDPLWLGETWYATDMWEDTEERVFDVALNASRKGAEVAFRQSRTANRIDIRYSDWREGVQQRLKQSNNKFVRWLGKIIPEISIYQEQPGGRETDQKLTIELDVSDDKRWNFGWRYRSRPGIFVSYTTNHKKHYQPGTRFDLAAYPASEFVELLVDTVRGADFSLRYEYDDKDLQFRLEDFPIGFADRATRKNIDLRGGVKARYNFDTENIGISTRIYLRW